MHPTAQDIARYRAWQRDVIQRGKRLALLRDVDTRTRDGTQIQLYANAELPADVAQARMWYQRAKEWGEPDAQRRLDALALSR